MGLPDVHSQPDVCFEMASHPRYLAAARAMVANVAQRLNFDEVQCGRISLAVDEALCNVINHGYERRDDGRIWLKLWALDGDDDPTDEPGLMIVVEDNAKQVDPQAIQPRDLADIRPGGLGVYIIREVMDHAEYEQRREGGMRLTLVKRRASIDEESSTRPQTERESHHG